jgi:hypothetical protein
MNNLNLSSSVPGFNGSLNNPSWESVLELLGTLVNLNGSIGLSIIDPPDIGPASVDVLADNGHFLVTLFENINESEDWVRSYNNTAIAPRSTSVEILGDLWDASMLTDDFSIVVEVFRSFYETGDVPHQLLA